MAGLSTAHEFSAQREFDPYSLQMPQRGWVATRTRSEWPFGFGRTAALGTRWPGARLQFCFYINPQTYIGAIAFANGNYAGLSMNYSLVDLDSHLMAWFGGLSDH